jgi:nucleotide-binding universal stress UspA family protein
MYNNIVLAYDGSKYSNKALQEAIRITKISGGNLLILSIVDVTDEFESQAPGLTEKMTEKLKKQVQKASEKATAENIKVREEIRVGDAYETIVGVAGKKRCDLIIMGSHGKTGLKRLLMGSVTSRVIGHAPCKVLVIP